MQHPETCLLVAETDRVLCNVVKLLTAFFYWMHKMKYSCWQDSSWLVCSLVFWLRNAQLVKVIGNPISDGPTPPCLMRIKELHLDW